MGKVILIVSNLSHFHGSLPVAEGLRELGNEVVYYSQAEYVASIRLHTYTANEFNIETSALSDSLSEKAEALKAELYNMRPDLVILDMDLAVYLILFSSFKIPAVLLNFFVPFCKQRNVPPFTSRWTPRNSRWSMIYVELLWMNYYFSTTYVRRLLIFLTQRKKVIKFFGTDNSLEAAYDRIFPGFKSQAEIHTCSSEFNFLHRIDKPLNFYLGHAVSGNRIHPNVDVEFDAIFDKIVLWQSSGMDRKLIYCSFGAYSRFHLKECLRFYHLLISLFRRKPDWTLLAAIGSHLNPVDFECSENVFFVQLADQLKVLEISNVTITHGGMNSVNESISKAVPMLVCPLNSKGDQPGNSARIEFHQIGISGMILNETEGSLEAKITALISNLSYKERIVAYRENMISSKEAQHTLTYLHSLANSNPPS